jgi:hypothetical protein
VLLLTAGTLSASILLLGEEEESKAVPEVLEYLIVF